MNSKAERGFLQELRDGLCVKKELDSDSRKTWCCLLCTPLQHPALPRRPYSVDIWVTWSQISPALTVSAFHSCPFLAFETPSSATFPGTTPSTPDIYLAGDLHGIQRHRSAFVWPLRPSEIHSSLPSTLTPHTRPSLTSDRLVGILITAPPVLVNIALSVNLISKLSTLSFQPLIKQQPLNQGELWWSPENYARYCRWAADGNCLYIAF